MSEWKVELKGDRFDLDKLASQCSIPELTIIEENGSYYLKSKDFETMINAEEVHKYADGRITDLNGAAKIVFDDFQDIKFSGNIIRSEDGKNHSTVMADAFSIRCRIIVKAKAVGGIKTSSEPESLLQLWCKMAMQDEKVKKVLRIYGSRQHDWHNLYNLYEVIEEDIGSKTIEDDWGMKSQKKLFKHTANTDTIGDDARHAHNKCQPPRSPMSLTEAESFIKALLSRWIISK